MRSRGVSKRSPNTCAECRARKVKCDDNRNGDRGRCGGCERLKLDCSFGRVDPEVDGVAQPDRRLESRKKKTACMSCRSLKAKCDGEVPSCMRCLRKRRTCQYPSTGSNENEVDVRVTNSQMQEAQITTTVPASLEPVLPSLENSFVLRMIEAFFQHIHPIPVYSYLHKASLVQRFERGLLDQALLLALAGTTCELLDMGADLKAQSSEWMTYVERSVMKEFCRPSVIRIQVLVMLIKHCMRQGRLSNAFMLHAVAARGAFALGLNYEAPKLGFLARESRRRLMWSLYIIDTRLAGGMSDFTLYSASSMRIQLPCHERNFEFDLQQDVEGLEPVPGVALSDSVGSLAIYIRLMWFRHRILQTTKEAVLNSRVSIDHLTASIEQLGNEMRRFETSLPQSLQYSRKSLQLRAYSTRLGPYLLIHVWLRQCHCDLYRIALTGLKEALPAVRVQQVDPVIVESWRRRCFDNAMALASVFSHFATLKNGCPVVEHDIIACAYQCARLLLHSTSRYGEALQIDHFAVQKSATQCLEAVKTMQSRSPMGDMITRDLARLLQRGSSPSPQFASTITDSRTTSTTSQLEDSTGSHHLFSRHSAIGQMRITDEEADLHPSSAQVPADAHESDLTQTTETIPHVPPVQDTSDFDFSNAFEGAFDDLDLSLHNVYWNPSIWLVDSADNNHNFEMPTWNG
ncbi:hypothetical protein C7974DRAFT_118693 [Boeremia exigua]|uniref:uncharacterized protein n=1 Tax=Boeremia exigua TaxID=749465 RepID=UPI001E8DCF81|nr:uncharacterized protein C7974DRAFT_118693 [Boeremia exigua]KAH6643185.1 hypothetical protein C7974DRAFT_118693 [Boeremia exigua]